MIRDALTEFLWSGLELRVLTTVYTGATEQLTLDELYRLGARIKVSYEPDQIRLHAKAWLLHRTEGLSTAYIGSEASRDADSLSGQRNRSRSSRLCHRQKPLWSQ